MSRKRAKAGASRIAAALEASIANVERTRRQWIEEGFGAGAEPHIHSKLRAKANLRRRCASKLIAPACVLAPEGCARRTFSLLEAKVVELNLVAKAGDNTIGRTLNNTLKPPLKQQWVIAPAASAAFVADMGGVPEVYHRPHDPQRPVVCVDETAN